MKYTEEKVEILRARVGERLSQRRFAHTLGVVDMAVKIGEKCLPDRLNELRAAALLHDISKEYSEAEQLELIKRHKIPMTEAELSETPLWHSMTGGAVIREDFPEYAESDILSAVYNHTVGSPDMSVFDEIILLADYIEAGRKYERCVALRESFLNALSSADSVEEATVLLHFAVAKSLDNNIEEFISRGRSYHERTRLTRDAVLAKAER